MIQATRVEEESAVIFDGTGHNSTTSDVMADGSLTSSTWRGLAAHGVE